MPFKMVLATTTLAEYWHPSLDMDNGHYPLGLGYLQAVAEQAGHRVESLYLVREAVATCTDKILDAVKCLAADVLGLSVITDNRVSTFRVIEAAHERFPDLRIVLGGIHVSTMYEQIVDRYPFVVAVLGEGEITLVDLLDAFETGRDLSEVQGIAFFRDGRVVKTAERPLIEDLDSLPLPRHDIFYSPTRQTGQLLTSRGCPFTCSFCALDSTSRRKVRTRSPSKVVDEIEKILSDHPQTTTIYIVDDQFFVDNKRVIAICDEIVRRGIKCRFICQGRVRPLSRELVLALERAGFVAVSLGLESGSAAVLERCKKKISLEDVERAVRLFADSNIEIGVLLIIGLPGENLQTIQETTDFCKKLQKIKYHVYDNKVQDLFIYPGTEIYEIAKSAGAINDDYWLGEAECPRFHVEIGTSEFISFREILLARLCPTRIFTPGGFAAQRDMIPLILKHIWSAKVIFEGHRALREVQEVALKWMVEQGRTSLSLSKAIPAGTCLITAFRKPGSDTEVVLDHEILPTPLPAHQLIRLAQQHGITPVVDSINDAVTMFLEEGFARGDNRLDAIPSLPKNAIKPALRY